MPTVVGEMMPLRFGCDGQQRRGLVERLLVVVVAVDRVDELDVGVVGREVLLHQVDPGVLVGRVGRGRQDRDLARAADLLGDHARPGPGRDALGVGLADEQVAALGVGVGVEGDHLGAGVARLVEGVTDRGRVVGRDDERAHALLGRGVDERHLGVGRRLRPVRPPRRCRRTPRRPLAAGGAGVEVRVAEVLGQERDRDVAAAATAVVAAARRRRRCRTRPGPSRPTRASAGQRRRSASCGTSCGVPFVGERLVPAPDCSAPAGRPESLARLARTEVAGDPGEEAGGDHREHEEQRR